MTPPRNFPFISPRTSAPPGRGVSRRRYRLRFIRQENRNVHGNAAIPQRVFRRDGIELEPKAPPQHRGCPYKDALPRGGGGSAYRQRRCFPLEETARPSRVPVFPPEQRCPARRTPSLHNQQSASPHAQLRKHAAAAFRVRPEIPPLSARGANDAFVMTLTSRFRETHLTKPNPNELVRVIIMKKKNY